MAKPALNETIIVVSCYNYDSNPQWCEDLPSTLNISDVNFLNVTGWASGNYPNNTVISLRCSGECPRFVAKNTNIKLYAVSRGLVLSPKARLTYGRASPSQNLTDGQAVCTNLVDPDLDFDCIEVPYGAGNQLTQLPNVK